MKENGQNIYEVLAREEATVERIVYNISTHIPEDRISKNDQIIWGRRVVNLFFAILSKSELLTDSEQELAFDLPDTVDFNWIFLALDDAVTASYRVLHPDGRPKIGITRTNLVSELSRQILDKESTYKIVYTGMFLFRLMLLDHRIKPSNMNRYLKRMLTENNEILAARTIISFFIKHFQANFPNYRADLNWENLLEAFS